MDNFFYKTILLTVLSLSSLLVFPQTKIGVYNGNPAQKENKIFAQVQLAGMPRRLLLPI